MSKDYNELEETIDNLISRQLITEDQKDDLYDLVVDEYLDMEENPNDASEQDCIEIADSSGL